MFPFTETVLTPGPEKVPVGTLTYCARLVYPFPAQMDKLVIPIDTVCAAGRIETSSSNKYTMYGFGLSKPAAEVIELFTAEFGPTYSKPAVILFTGEKVKVPV